MSDVVQFTCSLALGKMLEDHLAELQIDDPAAGHDNTSAADHLIGLGFLLSCLPESEVLAVVARANEIIAEK